MCRSKKEEAILLFTRISANWCVRENRKNRRWRLLWARLVNRIKNGRDEQTDVKALDDQ